VALVLAPAVELDLEMPEVVLVVQYFLVLQVLRAL
jgi:hypothetical protein